MHTVGEDANALRVSRYETTLWGEVGLGKSAPIEELEAMERTLETEAAQTPVTIRRRLGARQPSVVNMKLFCAGVHFPQPVGVLVAPYRSKRFQIREEFFARHRG
jgi:hypothetical protein